MDNTPLDPDIQSFVPDSVSSRYGSFVGAVPRQRRLYRTYLTLRILSILVGLIILSITAAMGYKPPRWEVIQQVNLPTGGTPAAAGIVWSLVDIFAMFVRDHWRLRWTRQQRVRWKRKFGEDMDRFSWGHPGWHVAAHLIIWLMATGFLVWLSIVYFTWATAPRTDSSWISGYSGPAKARLGTLVVFDIGFTLIHFCLLVGACVATEGMNRDQSDVVFVPREDLQEMRSVPPTSLWEVVRARRLPLAFFANHYVRFVPNADGTVQVARDYSSRQARV